jgi:hypothetical protein
MALPMNSTNVRIMAEGAVERGTHSEDARRTLLVALAAWAGLVALGAADGVFARLAPAVDAALVAFAAVFALATCCLDRSVGAVVERVPLALLGGIAVGVDAAVAAAWAASGLPALVAGPGAFLAFFAAPVAIAAHAAAARRLAARLRSRAARSPAARPAST